MTGMAGCHTLIAPPFLDGDLASNQPQLDGGFMVEKTWENNNKVG